MKTSVICGIGAYLPERIMLNKELEERVETNDAWIQERTGIKQRHIAADNQHTSDLAANAAREALESAGISVDEIGIVIVATATPDETMPSTAARTQHKLGIKNACAFDVGAACSGFVYALTIADSMLKSSIAKYALVIGAEIYSRILNWDDRNTCILFGDGAGAVLLESIDEKYANGRGIKKCIIRSDGAYADLIMTSGGVATTQTAGKFTMQGKEVFKHASAKMSQAVLDVAAASGISVADIDYLIPHQANIRIMASVANKLGISEEKVISTVNIHANTSAASIPLAIYNAVKEGKITQKKCLAITALGAGLTWGSCIINW